MRRNRYPVVDGDGHVMERNSELATYLGEDPLPHETFRLDTYSLFPSLDGWFRPNLSSAGQRDNPDSGSWLQFLDECGIQDSVLLPTAGLAAGQIEDRSWAVNICRAYNDWLHERYAQTSPRFHGVALLPVQEVPAAVQELRRAVDELGFCAGLLPAVTVLGKAYGHQDFWPLYAEAERLGVALTVHGAPGRGLGLASLESFIESHTLKHPFAIIIQLTSMLFQGVFEAFPGLRVAYLEAGAGWMPWLMDRMDEEYERRGNKWAPRLHRQPSAILAGGQVYVSLETQERTLPTVLDIFGEDHVLFASDYPHERPHSAYLLDIPTLAERSDISETAKRKILADNARYFYRLN